jgi:hypothetical protein
MSWIKVTERDEATAELADAYGAVAGARGTVANILKVHSIHPPSMLAHLGLYRELMFGPSKLTRALEVDCMI